MMCTVLSAIVVRGRVVEAVSRWHSECLHKQDGRHPLEPLLDSWCILSHLAVEGDSSALRNDLLLPLSASPLACESSSAMIAQLSTIVVLGRMIEAVSR